MCVKAALNTVVKHGRRVCVGDDATKFAKRWMPSNGANRGIIRKTPDVANGLSLCVTVKYFVRRSQHKWQDNVNGEVWPSIAKRGAYGSRKSKRTFCIGCDSNPLRRQSALGFIEKFWRKQNCASLRRRDLWRGFFFFSISNGIHSFSINLLHNNFLHSLM